MNKAEIIFEKLARSNVPEFAERTHQFRATGQNFPTISDYRSDIREQSSRRLKRNPAVLTGIWAGLGGLVQGIGAGNPLRNKKRIGKGVLIGAGLGVSVDALSKIQAIKERNLINKSGTSPRAARVLRGRYIRDLGDR